MFDDTRMKEFAGQCLHGAAESAPFAEAVLQVFNFLHVNNTDRFSSLQFLDSILINKDNNAKAESDAPSELMGHNSGVLCRGLLQVVRRWMAERAT